MKFTKEEIALMRVTLMLKSPTLNQYWQQDQYVPTKEDEFVALTTFKEFKKSFKKNEKDVEMIEDAELDFGTEAKALLIKRLNEFPMGVMELEIKIPLLEKLA